mgnify:CR=1 FL=1
MKRTYLAALAVVLALSPLMSTSFQLKWTLWLSFAILALQALSELVKRIAFLRGLIPEPFSGDAEKSDEERLAEELAAEAEKHLKGA